VISANSCRSISRCPGRRGPGERHPGRGEPRRKVRRYPKRPLRAFTCPRIHTPPSRPTVLVQAPAPLCIHKPRPSRWPAAMPMPQSARAALTRKPPRQHPARSPRTPPAPLGASGMVCATSSAMKPNRCIFASGPVLEAPSAQPRSGRLGAATPASSPTAALLASAGAPGGHDIRLRAGFTPRLRNLCAGRADQLVIHTRKSGELATHNWIQGTALPSSKAIPHEKESAQVSRLLSPCSEEAAWA